MIKNSHLRKAVVFLLFTTVILACTSYILWQKNQTIVRHDYEMYLKSQYHLKDLITNCLKVRYQRGKLIDNLALLKGEFMLVEHVFEQVTIPENLRSFHNRGLRICNQAFSGAVQGKSVTVNMNELQVYMEELDELLLELNSAKLIDNNTPGDISQKLEDVSTKIEQQ